MISGPALHRLAPVLFLGAILISCAAPPKAVPTPPPPPAIPTVSLSPQVVQAASAYRYYMARSSLIAPAFADGDSVTKRF